MSTIRHQLTLDTNQLQLDTNQLTLDNNRRWTHTWTVVEQHEIEHTKQNNFRYVYNS
jgi:hypothetical protein